MEAVSHGFRRHPDLEPTGKLTIIGQARCSAERMNAYLRRRNPKAPELAELYLRQGRRYGVRGDVAYCQMIYETRAWTKAQSGPSWEPLTLAQWAEEQTVDRLMRILYAFACDEPLPADAEPIEQSHDERMRRAGWRGMVSCWEDLNGKWTERGDRYGQDVVAIWRNMKEWRGKGEVFMITDEEREKERDNEIRQRLGGRAAGARTADWTAVMSEDMQWLKERDLLPTPVPHPDRKVTWAELSALLRKWEKPPESE
ncbi:hypothetical protein [Cohnella yongneupensis]|uniref:Uncharacterized protein n=1 Tax=Cohnella yongneupensis TaxID=425006 RepID=A0ABW0R0P4_9BACL